MNNTWTEINDEVPHYMDAICKKYKMRCEKIDILETALFNKNCCLIIQIGRFGVDLVYVYSEKEKLYAYQCGSYLALRYDDDDRQGLISQEGAGNIVRNELIIIANGLVSKCQDVLLGEKGWIEKYKQSSQFLEVRLSSGFIDMLSAKRVSKHNSEVQT